MHVEEEDDDDEPPKSFFKIPKRYVVMIMIFLVSPISYGSRSLLSQTEEYFSDKIDTYNHSFTAAVDQCTHLTKSEEKIINITFTKLYQYQKSDHINMKYYYYVSYMIGQIISGIFSDTYNPKQTLALGFLMLCIVNLFTPLYITIAAGNLIATRILYSLSGFSQGTFYPPTITLLAHWAPLRERAFMTSVSMSGFYVGTIITNLTIDWIVETAEAWSAPFYIFGGIGIGLLLLWEYSIFSYPDKHPRIDEEEKLYLEIEMHGLIDQKRKSIPYWFIIKSINFWAYLVVAVSGSWIWSLITASITNYMTIILKYSHRESELVVCIPYSSLILSLGIFGFFSDWLMRKRLIDRLTLRKTFASIGLMGPPIYMLTGSYASCHRTATILMFMISLALLGFVYLGVFLIPMDIAPNYAGFLTAVGNVVATAGRILQSHLIDYLLPNHAIQEYRETFWIALAIAATSNIFFVIFGSSTLQAWNQRRVKNK